MSTAQQTQTNDPEVTRKRAADAQAFVVRELAMPRFVEQLAANGVMAKVAADFNLDCREPETLNKLVDMGYQLLDGVASGRIRRTKAASADPFAKASGRLNSLLAVSPGPTDLDRLMAQKAAALSDHQGIREAVAALSALPEGE